MPYPLPSLTPSLPPSLLPSVPPSLVHSLSSLLVPSLSLFLYFPLSLFSSCLVTDGAGRTPGLLSSMLTRERSLPCLPPHVPSTLLAFHSHQGNRVTPVSHCTHCSLLRPLMDLIGFAWGNLKMRCGSVHTFCLQLRHTSDMPSVIRQRTCTV